MVRAHHTERMRMKVARGGAIAFAAAIGSLVLVGCTSNYHSGPGMMGTRSVYHSSTVTCTPPANLPGRLIKVAFGDMGMMQMMGGTAPLGRHMRLVAAPATITAGRVSVVAINMGWRTHELVILPLADGQSAGQRVSGSDGKVDEAGSLGEASTSCGAGTGDGVEAGSVTWTTLTLSPGRYEFICNLKNHYADGMYQEVQVTSL